MTFNLISPAQIIGIRCGEHAGLNGWINLPKNLSLSYNLGCDWMEEELWSFGPFMLTRLLSDEEQGRNILKNTGKMSTLTVTPNGATDHESISSSLCDSSPLLHLLLPQLCDSRGPIHHSHQRTMNAYLTQVQRQSLIDQYMDCYLETGGDEDDGMEMALLGLSNPELIAEIESSGWGISL